MSILRVSVLNQRSSCGDEVEIENILAVSVHCTSESFVSSMCDCQYRQVFSHKVEASV